MLDTVALHGLLLTISSQSLGTAKPLPRIKTPTRFALAHYIISGSIPTHRRRLALQTLVSLRQVRQFPFQSRHLTCQIRPRRLPLQQVQPRLPRPLRQLHLLPQLHLRLLLQPLPLRRRQRQPRLHLRQPLHRRRHPGLRHHQELPRDQGLGRLRRRARRNFRPPKISSDQLSMTRWFGNNLNP